jgi:hypothetical protein
MDMVTMLVMQVTTVNVIDVTIVFNGFMTITFKVFALMILVNERFGMQLPFVLVINVTSMFDGLMTIIG